MWKKIFYIIKSFVVSLSLTALAAGCVQDDGKTLSEGDGMSPSSYVSLCFVSSEGTFTRSNPTGGELGDGLEKGQDYENKISSAVAFFFSGDNGVNSEAMTPIKATVVFNEFSEDNVSASDEFDRIYTTVPQKIDLDNGVYDVLIVANPGSDWWSGKVLTLADVRDHIQTEAWTEILSESDFDYSNFVMTSASDTQLTLNSNSVKDPAVILVNVERMAARLDYKAVESYTCTDPNYSGATVEILGAVLVNNLTAGSFLMKRVAKTVDGVPDFLGNETIENGIQSNYVLDPWTSDKVSTNNSFLINGASNRPASELFGIWYLDGSEDPNWWSNQVKTGTSISDGNEIWQRIGYTLENTTKDSETGKRYSTGVVFKAQFHPKGLLNYKDGETFFALGTQLYASMEDMMTRVYGTDFSQQFSEIKQCKNWGQVKEFINETLQQDDPSGYYSYLSKLVEDKNDDDPVADIQSLVWEDYMLNECGYSRDSNGKVLIDQNGKITRIVLKPYGVRTYKNGICYYTWWVRHSNDQDDNINGVMEYAVVRNNIYKLTVKAIYSLGGDVPNGENIIVDIYVNDWLLLDSEILPM